MAKTNEEVIELLEGKVNELTKLLEETLAEGKGIAKIVAGPFEDKGANYYRASKGEKNEAIIVFVSPDPLFGNDPIPAILEPDTEVVITGQTIISVVPKELKPIAEPVTMELIGWNEIGGLKSQIHDIREAVESPILNAKLAEELGVTPIAGILLYGPPGTGKTYIAKAIASTVFGSTTIDPDAFIYIKGGEELSMYVGATEQNIKGYFARAREYTRKTGKKAIMFIDEAEALLPTRGSRKSSDVETTIVPTFLGEMSGLDSKDNPIVILATNHKNALDSAVTREGRIDIKVEIKRPDLSDTKEILEIHLKKFKTHDSVEVLADFASNAIFGCSAVNNVSGAMCEVIVKDAIRKAMTRLISSPKDKAKGITIDDIACSIKSISQSYVTKA